MEDILELIPESYNYNGFGYDEDVLQAVCDTIRSVSEEGRCVRASSVVDGLLVQVYVDTLKKYLCMLPFDIK